MQIELIPGNSPAFAETLRQAEAFAATEWPVLVWGETGAGKDCVAHYIHSRSRRARYAFLPLNCGTLPVGLFESELFGYQRGAFSGAHSSSKGLVRTAAGGTIFLDEIGELDPISQVKLLRLLDNAEVRPLGATRPERSDVRWICATNIDLPTAVAEGRFRHDLYERLAVLSLRVPSLRERPEDVLPLARHLLQNLNAQFEDSVLKPLQNQAWPGNIRQLRNVLTRACILGGKHITPAILARLLREEDSVHAVMKQKRADALSGSLDEIEQRAVAERLFYCGGNRKKTAEELGIAKSTLHEKLRKWKAAAPTMAALDPFLGS